MATDVRLAATTATTTTVNWRKSEHSGKEGNCVEVACLLGDARAMRDSKAPEGAVLVVPARHMAAFLAAARTGAFHV